MKPAPLSWSLVALVIGHCAHPAWAAGFPPAQAVAGIDVVLCDETLVVYSVRAGDAPMLCAYSPSDGTVRWRRATLNQVVQAARIDRETFAMIENGELQFCRVATGTPIRRVALAALPGWASPANREAGPSAGFGERPGVTFHTPRAVPSGVCVWRSLMDPGSPHDLSTGWGLIDHDAGLLLSAPEGAFIGYAPNGRPLLGTGHMDPRLETIREGELVDATELLFRQLKTDHPGMTFSLLPRPDFSARGQLAVAMWNPVAPAPENRRIHDDGMAIIHIVSGSCTMVKSPSNREFYEGWAIHNNYLYRHSTSIESPFRNQDLSLWVEVYDVVSGEKLAGHVLTDLDPDGDMWLRGFTSVGDPVYVHQKVGNRRPGSQESWVDSHVLILNAKSLATRRKWPLSVDGRPSWARDVILHKTHGIVQTFADAKVMKMPASGAIHQVMGMRALDPYSGRERWRHTERMLLQRHLRAH